MKYPGVDDVVECFCCGLILRANRWITSVKSPRDLCYCEISAFEVDILAWTLWNYRGEEIKRTVNIQMYTTKNTHHCQKSIHSSLQNITINTAGRADTVKLLWWNSTWCDGDSCILVYKQAITVTRAKCFVLGLIFKTKKSVSNQKLCLNIYTTVWHPTMFPYYKRRGVIYNIIMGMKSLKCTETEYYCIDIIMAMTIRSK